MCKDEIDLPTFSARHKDFPCMQKPPETTGKALVPSSNANPEPETIQRHQPSEGRSHVGDMLGAVRALRNHDKWTFPLSLPSKFWPWLMRDGGEQEAKWCVQWLAALPFWVNILCNESSIYVRQSCHLSGVQNLALLARLRSLEKLYLIGKWYLPQGKGLRYMCWGKGNPACRWDVKNVGGIGASPPRGSAEDGAENQTFLASRSSASDDSEGMSIYNAWRRQTDSSLCAHK